MRPTPAEAGQALVLGSLHFPSTSAAQLHLRALQQRLVGRIITAAHPDFAFLLGLLQRHPQAAALVAHPPVCAFYVRSQGGMVEVLYADSSGEVAVCPVTECFSAIQSKAAASLQQQQEQQQQQVATAEVPDLQGTGRQAAQPQAASGQRRVVLVTRRPAPPQQPPMPQQRPPPQQQPPMPQQRPPPQQRSQPQQPPPPQQWSQPQQPPPPPPPKQPAGSPEEWLFEAMGNEVSTFLGGYRSSHTPGGQGRCSLCDASHAAAELVVDLEQGGSRAICQSFLSLAAKTPSASLVPPTQFVVSKKSKSRRFRQQDGPFVTAWRAYFREHARFRLLCQPCAVDVEAMRLRIAAMG